MTGLIPTIKIGPFLKEFRDDGQDQYIGSRNTRGWTELHTNSELGMWRSLEYSLGLALQEKQEFSKRIRC